MLLLCTLWNLRYSLVASESCEQTQLITRCVLCGLYNCHSSTSTRGETSPRAPEVRIAAPPRLLMSVNCVI